MVLCLVFAKQDSTINIYKTVCSSIFSFNDYFRDIFTSLSLKSVTKIHFVTLPIADTDILG